MNVTFFILAFMGLSIGVLLWWQWNITKRSRQNEGRPAPDTRSVDGGDTSTHKLYYFHSLHCGPCRAITPLVDNVRSEFPNLIKVDVEQHMELASEFAIAATPSFIWVVEGVIREVKLGAVSEGWLRQRVG